jgi:hypothetical protein
MAKTGARDLLSRARRRALRVIQWGAFIERGPQAGCGIPDLVQGGPPSARNSGGVETIVNPADSEEGAVAATRAWLETTVIGLNLCPFASAVHHAGQIRYFVSRAETGEGLRADLISELLLLGTLDPAKVDTTLLIHPHVFGDFLDYNDFLDEADATLRDLGLVGTFQIASFHPRYQFAGTEPGDVTNLTSRSPYPTLHLLRESSVERALEDFPDADLIPQRNIETLRRLGPAGSPPPRPAAG